MDEKIKEDLEKTGHIIVLNDFEIKLYCDGENPTHISTSICKKKRDDNNIRFPERFTEKEIEMLIDDLNDLSDWRHYRKLVNKLKG